MTQYPIPDSPSKMGRPPLNVKPTQVRLPEDVRLRIENIVGKNRMAGFIREAVEAELVRREGRPVLPILLSEKMQTTKRPTNRPRSLPSHP